MNDPYKMKLTSKDFFHSKKEIKVTISVVLKGSLNNRGLNLIDPISRAYKKHDIIELIATDETEAAPGKKVNSIAYIAFVELQNSGVILVGDPVLHKGKEIGKIAGYDDTHLPNHQNVIVKVTEMKSGEELNLKVDDEIIFPGF
jgi:hypothetical protein